MNFLIAKKPIFQLGPQISHQKLIFESLQKNPRFIIFPARKYSFGPKVIISCSAIPADSLGYGGWDCQLGGKSGESNLLQSFLISLGISDKKILVVYFLGFISALAVFRVKLSSLIAFPACAFVFAVGFSVGFVNGGQMRWNEKKKMTKDVIFQECMEKFRNLVDLLNGCDVKVVNLRDDVRKAVEYRQITYDDLENILKAVESVILSTMDARNAVEDCIESLQNEYQEAERTSNQKSSKKRKEVGEHGFSIAQFLFSLFQGKHNPGKMKDSGKKGPINMEVNERKQENILSSPADDRAVESLLNRYEENTDGRLSGKMSDRSSKTQYKDQSFIFASGRINTIEETKNMRMEKTSSSASEGLFDGGYHGYRKRRLHHMNNQEFSWKIDQTKEVETQTSRPHDWLLDSVDLAATVKHQNAESFWHEQKTDHLKVKEHLEREESQNHAFESFSRWERVSLENEPSLADHESRVVSEDMEFSKCLSEADTLLKEAKECKMQVHNDGVAENALYNSARLLTRALNIRPMSLVAVGQLGNTYLLHGELKLRLSRELRAVLARADPISDDEWDEVDGRVDRRDKMISVLVKVCEECEELLVEAGRKYKLALSIDRRDMRALYNWGLALFFRAQLIADIGPGSARDADKIFLAAIDKFDAMISRSNLYAPDALFRWGAALQQRSRLRPRRSKEKVKLLQQARRLYQDALDMDSDNIQVKEALSSCVFELKHWNDS